MKFDAEQSTCTRLGDCTSMHNLPIFGTTKSCCKLYSDVEQNSEPQGKKWRQQATPLGWVCTTKNSTRHCEYLSLIEEIEPNFNISADFNFHLLLFLPSACKGCTYHQRLGKGPQTAVPCHKASDVVPQQKYVETLP